jgi:outer membrane protein assembly factor BamB
MKFSLPKTFLFLLLFSFFTCIAVSSASAQADKTNQWTTWRGPGDNGVVEDQQPVTTWSESENVLWSTELPGRGHSTPIIVGDRVFLTTSDTGKKTQSVLCLSRDGGKMLWEKVVNKGNFNPKIYPKNTHASPTVACDGERVFALFNNTGQNQVTALDLEGNILWQRHIAKFETTYPFGSGSSPILYDGLLYVPNEANTDCAIICLDPETGKEVKRIDRGRHSSYSTPVVASVGGRKQLLMSGGRTVKGYDPESGNELWSVPTKWDVSCGTMVWSGDMVFASGGFPAQQTLAVNAKDGELIWDKPVKFYEQSMLTHDGRLYGLSDRGVVYCWDTETGEQLFKQRFEAPVSASPVLAGGNIYFTSEKGNTLVLQAGVDNYKEIAKNNLGDSSFASFSIVDNKIFARVGFRQGRNVKEYLYCIGKE